MHIIREEELGAQAEQVSLACSNYVSNFDNQGRRDYQDQDEYVKAENSSQCRRKDSTLSYGFNLTMHRTNMKKLFKKKIYEKEFERSFCNNALPQITGKRSDLGSPN